jgi:hypothetical protein
MGCRHKGKRYDAWAKVVLWCRRHNKSFAHHDVRVNPSLLRYFQLRGELVHVGHEETPHECWRGTKLYRLHDKIDPWAENV